MTVDDAAHTAIIRGLCPAERRQDTSRKLDHPPSSVTRTGGVWQIPPSAVVLPDVLAWSENWVSVHVVQGSAYTLHGNTLCIDSEGRPL